MTVFEPVLPGKPEPVQDPGLKVGDEASAVIKSSDVIVAKD
jgi:molybdopterin-binding protein